MKVFVFREGPPGDAMWLLAEHTWDHIKTGNRETSGMWIRACDAVKLFQSGVAAGAATSATDWCGSEGGTPRSVGYSTARDEVPPAEDDESDFERRQRIAFVKADKQHDFDR